MNNPWFRDPDNVNNIPLGKRKMRSFEELPKCSFYHRRDKFACPQKVEKYGDTYCSFHIEGTKRKQEGICIASIGNAFKCNNYVTRGEIVCDHHLRAQKVATTRVLAKKKRKIEEVSTTSLSIAETAKILQEPLIDLGKKIKHQFSCRLGQMEKHMIDRLDEKMDKYILEKKKKDDEVREKEKEEIHKSYDTLLKFLEKEKEEIIQSYNKLIKFAENNLEEGEVLPFKPL
jgi:hypothetical protein